MRVLGIDPGLRNMGWGVIDVQGSRDSAMSPTASAIRHGRSGAAAVAAFRRPVRRAAALHAPDQAAVEQTFVNKDAVAR